MGTTLDSSPGVLGIADGAFFTKSLLKPLFNAEGKKKKKEEDRNHVWRAAKTEMQTDIIHLWQILKKKKKIQHLQKRAAWSL